MSEDMLPWPQGPDAHWMFLPKADAWVSIPLRTAVPGDDDTLAALTAAGYQRIAVGDSAEHSLVLFTQLLDIRWVGYPGGQQPEAWVRADSVARAQVTPVILAFRLPEHARPLLHTLPEVDGVRSLPMAQPLPPPQMGEVGLVVVGDYLRPYTLAALGEGALVLWQQLGTLLKEMAAPAEWRPYTRLMTACATEAGYQRRRDELRSTLAATRDRLIRTRLRDDLAALVAARAHVESVRGAGRRLAADRAAFARQLVAFEGMTQQLAEMYWQAHLANGASGGSGRAVAGVLTLTLQHTPGAQPDGAAPAAASDGGDGGDGRDEPVQRGEGDGRDGLVVLGRILETSSAQSIDVPSYQEDRAVREASLADKSLWTHEEGALRYVASNNLAVYFMDPKHPVPIAEAQARLVQIRESTVLTARIALGLWNLRRHDEHLCRNGAVAIRIDEILEWRGVQKHSRPAYPGAVHHVTDGYRPEQKEAVRQDFLLLRHYYLRGEHTVVVKQHARHYQVDGPYLEVTTVSERTLWSDEDIVGVFVAPGGWINTYEEYGNTFLAEVDRRIFRLVPQYQQHELRLGLYLVERWRLLAKSGRYDGLIAMSDLLSASVIPIDYKHLTERFIGRIEGALEHLRQSGIIGSYACLTPVDRGRARWGKDWLASRWHIQPPADLIRSYAQKIQGVGMHAALPDGRAHDRPVSVEARPGPAGPPTVVGGKPHRRRGKTPPSSGENAAPPNPDESPEIGMLPEKQ